MNLSSPFSFTSNWKEASELDQTAQQISNFLFPKRHLIARSRTEHPELSVTFWKEKDRFYLLCLTKSVIPADKILLVLDILSASIHQIGIPIDELRSQLTLNFLATEFDPLFLERLKFLLPKMETYNWVSSKVQEKEFIMLKEANMESHANSNGKDSLKAATKKSFFSSEDLSSQELSEFTRLGLDLRKIQ